MLYKKGRGFMDMKETQLVDYYHNIITTKAFSEKDIFALLMILRQYADKLSPVYEFANFVAHREKDRGFIKEYLETTKHKLDNIGKINTIIEIRPVFSIEEIEKSFNLVFKKLGKPEIPSEILNDVIICIIMLLQDVRIFDKRNRPIGKLVVGLSKTKLSLIGMVKTSERKVSVLFPVLEARNTIAMLANDYPEDEPRHFKSTLEVVNNEGRLDIVFYKQYSITEDGI
jgi:hypothetical protein